MRPSRLRSLCQACSSSSRRLAAAVGNQYCAGLSTLVKELAHHPIMVMLAHCLAGIAPFYMSFSIVQGGHLFVDRFCIVGQPGMCPHAWSVAVFPGATEPLGLHHECLTTRHPGCTLPMLIVYS